MKDFENIINKAWENKEQVNQNSDQNLKNVINQMIDDLDSGKVRVAEKINGEWVTHQHIKKAIMLSFRIHGMETLTGPYSVVVPGSLPDKNNPSAPSLYCAVIIKQVDEKTRSKTSINDLLRD